MKGIKWRIKAFIEILRFYLSLFKSYVLLFTNKRQGNIPKVCFIVGCGRSGTTILGELVARHPGVRYYNEPKHLWMTVLPNIDTWGYIGLSSFDRRLIIEDGSDDQKSRFNRLFVKYTESCQYLVEKSPENVFRLKWLVSLTEKPKIIYICRNGLDVIKSINREASFDIPYGLFDMNNWYGKREVKKGCLLTAARELGVGEETLAACKTNTDFAALEWICSLRSFRKYRCYYEREQILEVCYEKLLEDPVCTLNQIFTFLDIDSHKDLETNIGNLVKRPTSRREDIRIAFPLKVEFDKEMANLGYI